LQPVSVALLTTFSFANGQGIADSCFVQLNRWQQSSFSV
jgi:hypothetical protein